MLPITLITAAYLIGSIPFSFLVVRLRAGKDIREHGSGNVGATNVLRNFGKVAGIAALLLDVVKGIGTVALARYMVSRDDWPYMLGASSAPLEDPLSHPSFWIGIAALLAVVGHIFPVWLGFHGGKGVATAAGAFGALSLPALLAALIVFLATVTTTRYVSLASMLAAASIPLFLRYLTDAPFWIVFFSIIIAVLVILKHLGNISRLARGEERKIGERRELP